MNYRTLAHQARIARQITGPALEETEDFARDLRRLCERRRTQRGDFHAALTVAKDCPSGPTKINPI